MISYASAAKPVLVCEYIRRQVVMMASASWSAQAAAVLLAALL